MRGRRSSGRVHSAGAILDIVRATIARHQMICPNEKVLVACSGGPDSVALLHLLLDMHVPIAAAHLNHMLRGEESDRDAEFVRRLCGKLDIEITIASIDVAAEARSRRINIEDCARRQRLRFLRESAASANAARIALGHTADDLVETFIMKLIRGAGRTGLSSIAPVRGPFIRPLIDVQKEMIVSYLRDRGIPFVIDSTNADTRFLRNRVRAEVIPLLERVAPGAAKRITSAVAILQREEAHLQGEARGFFEKIRRPAAPGTIALDLTALRAASPAIRARALRLAVAELGSSAGSRPIVDLIGWCAERAGRARYPSLLPGRVAVQVSGDLLVFEGREKRPLDPFSLPLAVPGLTLVTEIKEEFRTRILDELPPRVEIDDWTACYLDVAKAGTELAVRSRRAGDRYRPLGAPGNRSVKKMLIDRKIPRESRSRVSVVTSGGRICWVSGLPVSEEFKVTGATQQIVGIKRLPSE